VAIAAAAFAGPANAVYKCTTVKGVVYQDRPCREGNETDVRLTVPTGEVAPKGTAAADDAVSPSPRRAEDRTQPVTAIRYSANAAASAGRRAEQKNEAGAGDTEGRRRDAPVTVERTAPISAEQARKTDPSAKYFATESFSSGNETPMQMNCESPTGEKRMFYLSDGKLTSI
jgi:hypothetical protein